MIKVVHHSADFDGLFCREIARKFLPDAELIGWDFGDKPLPFPSAAVQWVIMDLPVTTPFGLKFEGGWLAWDDKDKSEEDRQIQPLDRIDWRNVTWIDHHKSAIATHPEEIPGYRIDGVAACRLAYQWFACNEIAKRTGEAPRYPEKDHFVRRVLNEPLAVLLAGEYDVFDRRDPRAELFQHGLRSMEFAPKDWEVLLREVDTETYGFIDELLYVAKGIHYAKTQEYKETILGQGFDLEFEGLKYLACCSNETNIRSQLFEAGIKPEHDGLFGFTWTGKEWRVSLYSVPHKPDIDHSKIAVKYGGGGHKGACGFRISKLPFLS